MPQLPTPKRRSFDSSTSGLYSSFRSGTGPIEEDVSPMETRPNSIVGIAQDVSPTPSRRNSTANSTMDGSEIGAEERVIFDVSEEVPVYVRRSPPGSINTIVIPPRSGSSTPTLSGARQGPSGPKTMPPLFSRSNGKMSDDEPMAWNSEEWQSPRSNSPSHSIGERTESLYSIDLHDPVGADTNTGKEPMRGINEILRRINTLLPEVELATQAGQQLLHHRGTIAVAAGAIVGSIVGGLAGMGATPAGAFFAFALLTPTFMYAALWLFVGVAGKKSLQEHRLLENETPAVKQFKKEMEDLRRLKDPKQLAKIIRDDAVYAKANELYTYLSANTSFKLAAFERAHKIDVVTHFALKEKHKVRALKQFISKEYNYWRSKPTTSKADGMKTE